MANWVRNIFYRFSIAFLLLQAVVMLRAEDGDILNRKIELSKTKGTVYELLKEVSDKSGFLFVYDSEIIDNNRKVKIDKGDYSLKEAIYAITGNSKLSVSIVDNHILLRLPEAKVPVMVKPIQSNEPEERGFFTVSGTLFDRLSNEPIVYGAVSIENSAIGTVSNQNGGFKLVIPDSLSKSVIKFTHVGYESQEIVSGLLAGQDVTFSLFPKVVPLQEVVVRMVDPKQAVLDMVELRDQNYPMKPMYLTTFYREGIEYKKKVIDLTESVLKIYKGDYRDNVVHDQAKLIKMRRITDMMESDTIFPKMKSGINTCLMLDLMKDFPDFLNLNAENPYTYTHTDINVIDNRLVNTISFEQKEHVRLPLFKGELLIDAENSALLEARFEINPEYVSKATNSFVMKKNSKMKLTLEQAKYIVTYKSSEDGTHYINHVRGDLHFKVRKKRRLFSIPLHFWFEMVTCEIDTEDVKSFPRDERLPAHKIFSETKYKYDENFWGNFNVILPEEKLKELILNSLSKVSVEENE